MVQVQALEIPGRPKAMPWKLGGGAGEFRGMDKDTLGKLIDSLYAVCKVRHATDNIPREKEGEREGEGEKERVLELLCGMYCSVLL